MLTKNAYNYNTTDPLVVYHRPTITTHTHNNTMEYVITKLHISDLLQP